jgi:DMSO/TMAO reductase YedYZ molybdopterin-dependent catalytic subunit
MDIQFNRLSSAVALGAMCCGLAIAADPVLVVSGVSSAPLNLSLDDLAQMPRTKAGVKDHTYEGVLISTLLRRAGMKLDDGMRGPMLAMCVVAEAHDGYRALFSLSELDPAFTTGMVVIADRMDGKPLPERDGPLKIVVPGDKRADRWVRGVERLRVIRIEGNGARLSGAIETVAGKTPGKLQIEIRASNSDVAIATSADSLPPMLLPTVAFGPVSHVSFRPNGKTLGSLSGRVLGDEGAPIEGARVNLIGSTSTTAVTDSAGKYTFADLATRNYAFQVELKDFFPEIQIAAVRATGLRFNLSGREHGTLPRPAVHNRTKTQTVPAVASRLVEYTYGSYRNPSISCYRRCASHARRVPVRRIECVRVYAPVHRRPAGSSAAIQGQGHAAGQRCEQLWLHAAIHGTRSGLREV